METMLSLWRAGDQDAAITIWQGLSMQEQQNVFGGLVAMVNRLREERGDPPDATYGPPERQGL